MYPSATERAAAPDGAFVPSGDGVRVRLHVTPRAAADRVGDFTAGPEGIRRLKVAVTAAPHGGKANDAVIRLLAREWRIPKSALSVVAGGGGRDKVVAIHCDPDALAARLEAWSTRRGAVRAGRP